MKKLLIALLLVSGLSSAQTFDFECDDPFATVDPAVVYKDIEPLSFPIYVGQVINNHHSAVTGIDVYNYVSNIKGLTEGKIVEVEGTSVRFRVRNTAYSSIFGYWYVRTPILQKIGETIFASPEEPRNVYALNDLVYYGNPFHNPGGGANPNANDLVIGGKLFERIYSDEGTGSGWEQDYYNEELDRTVSIYPDEGKVAATLYEGRPSHMEPHITNPGLIGYTPSIYSDDKAGHDALLEHLSVIVLTSRRFCDYALGYNNAGVFYTAGCNIADDVTSMSTRAWWPNGQSDIYHNTNGAYVEKFSGTYAFLHLATYTSTGSFIWAAYRTTYVP